VEIGRAELGSAGVGRSVLQAVLRGVRGRCPACGEGRVFAGYLKATPACRHCGEGYAHLRADDMPPWLTILIVGHIVVPLVLLAEQAWHPAMWVQMAIWPAVTMALLLLTLPLSKGAVLGLLWATGAGEREEPGEP
jgi:uncharacterized protein (DUF983 family)